MTSTIPPTLLTSQTVLIIDDDPTIRAALTIGLEAAGRHLIVCGDLESAQMIIERFPVTHVMTDIKLTGPFRYEGLDVIDLVKKNTSTASIIIMTGHATEDLRAEAHARGATAVFQKPFSLSEIDPFLPAPESDSTALVTVVPTLDEMLSGDMMMPVFQPIVWIAKPGYAVGFEALTRLRTNSLFADPDLLFRYAFAKGRIAETELAAASRAIHAGRELAGLGFISINIHPEVFREADRLSDAIMDAATDAEVSPHRIVLEITEQASLPDLQLVEATSAALRAHGIRFAFDDVGTAYSHLRAIAAVRPSHLKISQHFGTGCESDPVKRKIVENVDALARSFNCEVVLEGIETEETARFARDFGIRFGQGFLYSRPTTPAILADRYALSG